MPKWVNPPSKGTDLFPNTIGPPPILRVLGGLNPEEEAALLSKNTQEINRFYLGQTQDYNAGGLTYVRNQRSIPDLDMTYINNMGTPMLVLQPTAKKEEVIEAKPVKPEQLIDMMLDGYVAFVHENVPGPFEFYLNDNLIYTSNANTNITDAGGWVEVLILRFGQDAMKSHSEPGAPTPPDKDSTTDLNNSHYKELFPKIVPDRLDQVIPRYWVYDWLNPANILLGGISFTNFNVVEVDVDTDLIKKYFDDFGLNKVRVRNKYLKSVTTSPSDTPRSNLLSPTLTSIPPVLAGDIVAVWHAGSTDPRFPLPPGDNSNTLYLAWGYDPPHVYNSDVPSILSLIGVSMGTWSPPSLTGWTTVLDQIFFNPHNPSVFNSGAQVALLAYVLGLNYHYVYITNEVGGLAGILQCGIYHDPGGTTVTKPTEFSCALVAEFYDRNYLRPVTSSWRYPPESADTLLVNDKPLFFGVTFGD